MAREVVAPIKSFGKPVGDILKRRPYLEMQSLLDSTQPKGRRNYWKNEYLPGIEPALGGEVNRYMPQKLHHHIHQ